MAANGTLARTLRTTEYFALAFGAMVGVGWLIVIDDWLGRGGPGGAMLGFLIGGLALLPVAYVYSKFVSEIPDASGEVAYATAVFPQKVGFVVGWMMTLAYLIVCPWEAVAIGKLVGYLFPAIKTLKIYTIGGFSIFLPALILGLATTAFVAFLNYRGIKLSSRFQNYTTFGLLLLFAVFCSIGASHDRIVNMEPFFAQNSSSFWAGAGTSIILVLQIVPYFLTGFESVGKCSEEAQAGFETRGFTKAIFLGLIVGTLFYVLIIAVVSGLAPWQMLAKERYATAVAFQQGTGSSFLVNIIFVAALFSLFKVFNANFLTASRLIFALGRRRLIAPRLGEIHPEYQSPTRAVLFCALITAFGPFLGDSILIPVTEVGALCSIVGWTVTCIAFLRWRKMSGEGSGREKGIAIAGTFVALMLFFLKLAPSVPGSFGRWEYAALSGWVLLGLCLHYNRNTTSV